ncbi:hypothetical protein DFP74_5051 [Nocardiopsis sp. Huas11]|uniref:hypothetical protein n=1 Tax=Nocardiopsis sp. Huas11 TaxID=2183912 RepID=UPI000EB2128A|nr:hypothetical protein [Nocardiopsis sp. Huas11]RKS09316.1 hypothetical protein DFP74_5051 [Nocardiopsis sp. Huas11]
MILVHPVVETRLLNGFALWPATDFTAYEFLALHDSLDPPEVGAAMMSIIAWNGGGPLDHDLPPAPSEPLEGFLHGFLVRDELFAPGGLRVTDTAHGTTLVPGCCAGLGEWRDWCAFVDHDRPPDLGHDPTPRAELSGENVRLTVDTERDDSPTIDLTAAELRPLLAGVERDLAGFLRLTAAWSEHHVPGHAAPVTAALARALDMPSRT